MRLHQIQYYNTLTVTQDSKRLIWLQEAGAASRSKRSDFRACHQEAQEVCTRMVFFDLLIKAMALAVKSAHQINILQGLTQYSKHFFWLQDAGSASSSRGCWKGKRACSRASAPEAQEVWVCVFVIFDVQAMARLTRSKCATLFNYILHRKIQDSTQFMWLQAAGAHSRGSSGSRVSWCSRASCQEAQDICKFANFCNFGFSQFHQVP